MNADRNGSLESPEVESLAQTVFTRSLIGIAFIAFVIAFFIALDPSARDPAIVSWRAAILLEIALAVGTPIVSSLAIYWFYSRVVEKRVLKVVMTNAAETAQRSR